MCEDDETTSTLTIACGGICQARTMTRFPGFPVTFWVELKLWSSSLCLHARRVALLLVHAEVEEDVAR
eukprot:1227442-Amphidinium_carterae.1